MAARSAQKRKTAARKARQKAAYDRLLTQLRKSTNAPIAPHSFELLSLFAKQKIMERFG